ncbi:Clp protease ClpP [Cytobacillus kochii]|uniref:head maturation protease, ClpP-related n=1 Tax=Cytobacillus kochii TaxID=859143 RepID=UPI001CD32693|nr:head maturation protease, ClpP-related [Cytobacillus kochii]MCA1029368.1 Clp protease ClpP [Cytobacillus kochii]
MKHKIKGDIISWNSSIWDFNYRMKSIKEDEDIDISINSYGGDAFLGIDICNTLRDHKGHVTITITGIAASAASVICMGADKLRAHANTMIMVHNALTLAYGNAKALRKAADDLEKVSQAAMQSYLKRVDADKMKKLMDEETYLTAQEALEIGLIDEIIDAEVEEVESEIFENKAKEFNNKITMQQSNSPDPTPNYEEIFNELKKEIEQLKNQKPKEPEQVPAQQKQNLSALFLNLKGE